MARRVAALVFALSTLPLLAQPALALSLRDIVELTKAGLTDEVLVALIEVDKPVFPIDSETLKALKAQGVSERVLIAIIRSGRTPQPAAASVAPEELAPAVQPAPPPPTVVVVDHHDPVVREVPVPVAVPVYIPVVQRVRRHDDRGRFDAASAGSPFYMGQVPRPEPKTPEPVYWGWGGKPRPDGWQPAPDRKK
jgi:hypothetical protein